MLSLGHIADPHYGTVSIDNRDQIVGSSGTVVNLYEQGQITLIEPPLADITAQDINNRGQVVGITPTIYEGEYGAYVAYLWTKKTGMVTFLGTMEYSSAMGINDHGQIVGSSRGVEGGGFLWGDGEIIYLGTLGREWATAYNINNRKQVVGWSLTEDNQKHAFLWEEGVMTDLNVLHPPDSGWELYNATDMNEHGEIVGYGVINGETHGFLMIPRPVP